MSMRKSIGIQCISFVLISIYVLLFSGCATLNNIKENSVDKLTKSKKELKPYYKDFKDILIPGEMTINLAESTVYQTAGFSTGVMVLYGKVEIGSLIKFFKVKMAQDGWNLLSIFKSAKSNLLFQKENRWAVIKIYRANFSAMVEIWVAPTIGNTENKQNKSKDDLKMDGPKNTDKKLNLDDTMKLIEEQDL